MEPEPEDDMLFLCAEDGSLALTGWELRQRNNQPGASPVHPIDSAGRVLHAWRITDRSGNPEYTEYTTTQGYLISDGKVITDREAFVEIKPQTNIVTPDQIHQTVADAREETRHGGLKRAHSPEELDELTSNAKGLSQLMEESFRTTLSIYFTGIWERTQPYLIGEDHEYRVPIKETKEVEGVRDRFMNTFRSMEQISDSQLKLLWQAAEPELSVDICLYIEGELVV